METLPAPDGLPLYSSVTKAPYKSKRRSPGSAIRSVVETRGPSYLRRRFVELASTATRAITEHEGTVIVCLLSPGKLNKDGYQQVNIKSAVKSSGAKQETAYLHHLAYWNATLDTIESWADSISHLCHHADCINPDHLVKEELWRNIKRQTCSGPADCTCNDYAPCLLPGNVSM